VAQYIARIVPPNPSDLAQFLQQELNNISRTMAGTSETVNLEMLYSAPKKPRDGMIALADGVNWNPGSGAGYYGYRSSAWRFLG
jgi:hypothetical protein